MAHPQIAAFARLADGKAIPTRRIEGQETLLGRTMHGMDYDYVHDEIVAPHEFGQAILTFRGGASGEEPPIRVIQGNLTQLARPDRVLVDSVNGEIIVPDRGQNKILIFAREANGNVAPIRILGTDTRPVSGSSAVDPINDLLVVVSRNSLMVFDRLAEGDAEPRNVIEGVGGGGVSDIRVYPEGGWILVARDRYGENTSDVAVWSIHDKGEVPPRWIFGEETLRKPRGMALDPANEIVMVSDKDLNAVLSYHVPELFRQTAASGRSAYKAPIGTASRDSAPGLFQIVWNHLSPWLQVQVQSLRGYTQ